MKKASSIAIIVIFLISLLPLQASAAQNEKVCCAKSKSGEYCTFTTEDKCDTSAEVKTKAGFTSSPFACSQLNDCKPVCCITAEGVCTDKVAKAQCRAQKGIPIDSPNCQIPECEQGACIIGNQCNFPTTAETCKRKAQDLKVKFIFDNSIKSLNECSTKYSVEEGCCVLSNQCSRTSGEQCTLQKGTFFPGKLCSNSELVSQCRGHTPQYAKQCTKEGDVYWVDSRGILENIVGSPSDGLIHNKEADIKGKPGDCDLSASTACSKDPNRELACINVDCKAGSIIEVKGLVQFNPKTGEAFAEQHTLTETDLGGAAERKNGETWCMTPGPAEANKPGSVHYVYSCRLGKVAAESCGDFRVKVCQQDFTSDGKSSARCIDNQWEDCWLFQGGNRKQQAFYPRDRVEPKDVSKEKKCALLGGSEFPSKSHCTLTTGGKNECLPKYPPGFEFWKSAQEDKLNKQRVCGAVCGAGRLNACDENECLQLGDCGNFDEGKLNWWKGAGIGAVVGFFSGVGINNIFHVGAGGGWLGGAASSKASLAASTAVKANVAAGEAAAIKAGTDAGVLAGATRGEALRAATAAYAKAAAGAAKTVTAASSLLVTGGPTTQQIVAGNTIKGTIVRSAIIGAGTEVASKVAALGLEPLLDNNKQQYKTENGDEVLYSTEDGELYVESKDKSALYNVEVETKK